MDDLIGKVIYFDDYGKHGLAKIIEDNYNGTYYCELLGGLRGYGHGVGYNYWNIAKSRMNLVDNCMELPNRLIVEPIIPCVEGDTIHISGIDGNNIIASNISVSDITLTSIDSAVTTSRIDDLSSQVDTLRRELEALSRMHATEPRGG